MNPKKYLKYKQLIKHLYTQTHILFWLKHDK